MLRGIPTVKSTTPPRDTARENALANARAAVEADLKKEAPEKSGESEKVDVPATENKKRARDDDDGADAAREAKKVDIKDEPVAAS